jgi:hypothetical protein
LIQSKPQNKEDEAPNKFEVFNIFSVNRLEEEQNFARQVSVRHSLTRVIDRPLTDVKPKVAHSRISCCQLRRVIVSWHIVA